LKKDFNTDVVGGALQQQQISTIALGSTTKIYNKFMTLLEVQGI
jgi:hypothetical protein